MKDLTLLSDRELLMYIQECSEKGLEDEMMRAHDTLLIRNGNDPNDFSDVENNYEPNEHDLKKFNRSEFESLNFDELTSVISNHENFYSKRDSKKALAIFIKMKKESPKYSDDDPDMLWAHAMKTTFSQMTKVDLISICLPLCIPFVFLIERLMRPEGITPFTWKLFAGLFVAFSFMGYRAYKR